MRPSSHHFIVISVIAVAAVAMATVAAFLPATSGARPALTDIVTERPPTTVPSRPTGAVAQAAQAVQAAASNTRPITSGGVTQPITCAWPVESTPSKANVAYPDSNATYWTTPFIAQEGMTITLNGTFPTARFFSFVVYNSAGQDFTTNGIPSSLTDYQMVPDPGTQNPWVTASAASGTYSVTLMNGVTSGMTNAIPLTPSTPSTPLLKGIPAITGFVTMRVYLPANNNANAIPLPTMTISTDNGAKVTTLKQCASAQKTPSMKTQIMKAAIAKMLTQTLAGKAGTPPTTSGTCSASLVFCKAGGSTTPFPNSDSGYVAARYQPAAGYVTVVKAKMPKSATAYGNGPGVWPASGINLRYWSFCNYVYAKPYPVVTVGPIMGCTADQDMPLVNGTATVVISSLKDRPVSTLGPKAKLGWLPTSPTNTTAEEVIAIRNMLAAPTFTQSVMNAENSNQASAQSTMGPYYPSGVQCTTATFAKGGAAGCFKNPASPS